MAGQRNTTTIPRAPCGRIILAAGAKRVAADAMDAMSESLQEYALEVSKKASEIAKHSGRKTIQDIDIKLAAKQ